MKNVFFASPQPYTVHLARLLCQEKKWQPVFFFTNKQSGPLIQEEFPTAQQFDYLSACKGLNPQVAKSALNSCLQYDEVRFLDDYLITGLFMAERNDATSGSFSFKDRIEFFYDRCRFWKFFLVENEVDIVVFEEEPHQLNDFIIFIVSKMLKLGTLMGIRSISDFGILYKEDYRVESPALLQKLAEFRGCKKGDLPELSEFATNYLAKVRGSYDEVLKDHLWDQVSALEDNQGSSSPWARAQKLGLGVIPNVLKAGSTVLRVAGRLGSRFESDQKVLFRELKNSRQSYFSFVLAKLITVCRKRRLKDYYEKVSTRVLDKVQRPYVLLALQYQPEKSTCPLAGIFVDQHLIIDTLRRVIPKDWDIVVREHPSQFVSEYSRYGERARSKKFYDSIVSRDGVYLASLNEDIFALLDSAKCVASAGGTSCWEGIIRGKPAITFADCWFSSLPGLFKVFDDKSLTRAIEAVREGFLPDQKEIELFVLALESVLERAAIGGPPQLAHAGLSDAQNARAHLRAITKYLGSSEFL